ncbi:hypothetical protein J0H58_20595 [bacterium]|nr:hypothetical protein [bacterium]
MADPLRCPVCDAAAPAEPAPSGEPAPSNEPVVCHGCGWPFDLPPTDDYLPFADDLPDRVVAIPVHPRGEHPRERRRRPPPDLSKGEYQAARLFRWGIILFGLLLIGSCLLLSLLTGPALQNGGLNPAGRPPQ